MAVYADSMTGDAQGGVALAWRGRARHEALPGVARSIYFPRCFCGGVKAVGVGHETHRFHDRAADTKTRLRPFDPERRTDFWIIRSGCASVARTPRHWTHLSPGHFYST